MSIEKHLLLLVPGHYSISNSRAYCEPFWRTAFFPIIAYTFDERRFHLFTNHDVAWCDMQLRSGAIPRSVPETSSEG